MTKILRNHIIHEFSGVCYENSDLYHERHDKRSRWARTFTMPHLHDERVVLATGPEVVDLWDALVAADLLVEEEFNV